MSSTTNSGEAIRAAWDQRVDSYAEMVRDPLQRALAVEIELAAFTTALPARPGLNLLDAGCGVGVHGVRLLEQGRRVTFVDVSPNMLRRARQTAEQSSGRPRAAFLEADIRDMPNLADASYDGIIAGGTVISDCGDPQAAMFEFTRVLRPGGILGLSLRSLEGPGNPTCAPVVRGGGAGFDWWFFSATSAEELCRRHGLILDCVYPVMMTPPTSRNADEYVHRHLCAASPADWATEAWEIFVVGHKPADASICT